MSAQEGLSLVPLFICCCFCLVFLIFHRQALRTGNRMQFFFLKSFLHNNSERKKKHLRVSPCRKDDSWGTHRARHCSSSNACPGQRYCSEQAGAEGWWFLPTSFSGELDQVPSERTLTCSVDLFTLTVTKQVHDGCKIAGGFLAPVHDLLVQRSHIVR